MVLLQQQEVALLQRQLGEQTSLSGLMQEIGQQDMALLQPKQLKEQTGLLDAGKIVRQDISLLQQKQSEEQINLADLSRQSVDLQQQTVTVLRDSLIYHRETAQNTAMLYELTDIVRGIVYKRSLPVTDKYRAKGL
jgi:hypothetical protein